MFPLCHDPGVHYAWALGLTLLVEVPVYTAALAATGGPGLRRAAAVAVVVNVVTHPVLWWAVRSAGSAYWAVVAVGETAVWSAEAWLVLLACRGRAGGREGVPGRGPGENRGTGPGTGRTGRADCGRTGPAGRRRGSGGRGRTGVTSAVALAASLTANSASVLAGLLLL